jgi:purine-binding chemotaxis protein CheW
LNATPLQRALQSAPARSLAAKARPELEFFCFKAGDLRLGVPSENVREVLRAGILTPLPRVPAFVLGVTGNRGEVIPVLDLLRFLGKGESRIGPRSRLFIGVSGSFVCGVLADVVIGLRTIPVSDVLPPPVGGDASSEFVHGIVQSHSEFTVRQNPEKAEHYSDENVGKDALTILHISKLLQSARQKSVQR